MAKSRRSKSKSSKPSRVDVGALPSNPTIRCEAEPGGTWAFSAWEPGSAETHRVVDGELARVDSRRCTDEPDDPIDQVPVRIEHDVAMQRIAYATIRARKREAELGWCRDGVVRLTQDPEQIRQQLEQRDRRVAAGGSITAGNDAAAPSFAGFGGSDDS